MTNWDHEIDLLVVGSGGDGMTAALVAKSGGLKHSSWKKQGSSGFQQPCQAARFGCPSIMSWLRRAYQIHKL
jgi:thioredoxin reductase